MEQLISTPLRPTELVLGKMLAYFGLGLIDMLTAITVSVLIFKVPLHGNPLLLIVTSCIFLLGALFWGILISALARSQLLAYQVSMITSFLPAFLLSGFIFDIGSMPTVVQAITHVIAARYYVAILQTVFLAGNVWSVILPNVLALLLLALVFLGLTWRSARKRLE